MSIHSAVYDLEQKIKEHEKAITEIKAAIKFLQSSCEVCGGTGRTTDYRGTYTCQACAGYKDEEDE